MPSANITGATAATARQASGRVLRKRILSALVLIPLALAGLFLGRPYWDGLVAVFAVLMAWEWFNICSGGRLADRPRALPASGFVAILAVLAAVAAALFLRFPQAFVLLLAGALATFAVAALERQRQGGWHGLGVLYVGVPCVAALWIRDDPTAGLQTLLWILALVWATDTGAYIAGRSIGGPKLARSISPKKTWSGLCGGVVSAAAVGLVAALWLDLPMLWPLLMVSAGMAVVEQVGDLAESAAKRRFGVKDSSAIIPGHGGVLDRVDGLLAVLVAVAGLTYLSGRNVLTWP